MVNTIQKALEVTVPMWQTQMAIAIGIKIFAMVFNVSFIVLFKINANLAIITQSFVLSIKKVVKRYMN